jgi:hypothetical protein
MWKTSVAAPVVQLGDKGLFDDPPTSRIEQLYIYTVSAVVVWGRVGGVREMTFFIQ